MTKGEFSFFISRLEKFGLIDKELKQK